MSVLSPIVLASVLFSVERWIRAGGYVVIFGLLFSCGLGVPLPEDIPLIAGGFLVGTGHLSLVPTAIAAWCGIIGGDLVLYHLGKRYGLNIKQVPFVGRHVTEERIRQAEVLFERYGFWVVAIGRLFAGVRGAMVIAAGAIRYNLIRFVIADGLAALVSGGAFLALGYWGGRTLGSLEKLQELRKRMAGVEHWIILAAVLVGVALLAYFWWRRRRHEKPSEVLLEKTVEHVTHAKEHHRK